MWLQTRVVSTGHGGRLLNMPAAILAMPCLFMPLSPPAWLGQDTACCRITVLNMMEHLELWVTFLLPGMPMVVKSVPWQVLNKAWNRNISAECLQPCASQEPKTEWDTPRVSPYRLAAHLTSAFAIYSGLLWTSLNMLYPVSSAALAPAVASAGATALRRAAHPLAALIGITAVSGNSCLLQMWMPLLCNPNVCMCGKQTFTWPAYYICRIFGQVCAACLASRHWHGQCLTYMFLMLDICC